MKSLLTSILSCALISVSMAQVPAPMSTRDAATSTIMWERSGEDAYKMYAKNGSEITYKFKDLTLLSTDTLAVLDTSDRIIYLLPDYENSPIGTKKEVSVLKTNVGKDFYITNPYSYKTYVNDQSYSPEVVNVQGSYVAYVKELDMTYLEKDIRAFPSWGAMDLIKLPPSSENTYWYRDREKKEYGVINKGETIDYDLVTSRFDGDDLVLDMSGVAVYRLVDYKLTGSFVYKPVQMIEGSSSSQASVPSSSKGCVSGDCQNGFGYYKYEGGSYEGFWTNGLRSGYGLYKWDDGATFIGSWVSDAMTGYGLFTAANNDLTKGEFVNGQLQGIGVTRTGEDWKQGTWSSGNQTEVYNFYGNDVEEGCTIGDCQNKYGKMVWSNGDTYVGFFKNGTMRIGTYSFAGGAKYSGEFNSQGQFNGMGRFWFANGDYYGGEWKNGKYHGTGYFSPKDTDDTMIGIFENGSLVKDMN